MRGARFAVLLLAGLLIGSVVTAASADTTEVTEYTIPSAERVESVAVAFGSVWAFSDSAEPGGGSPTGIADGFPVIYKLDPATGEVQDSYTLPTKGIGRLVAGPEAIWYTLEGDGEGNPGEVIGRLDPDTGLVDEFPIGAGVGASRIVVGFGDIWFTDAVSNFIGQLDPDTGNVTTHDIPTADSLPIGIGTGFGYVWFAEGSGGNIGRLDPGTGGITEFAVDDAAGVICCGVATGFDAVWFAMGGDNRIGKLDPTSGSVTTYLVPTPGSYPVDIVAGPNGSMWFTELLGDQIGRLDPVSGSITEYGVPTAGSRPFGIAAGSIWFAEEATGKVGKVKIDRFSDDEGSVFEDDIEWLAEEGITKGCNPPVNDRYCPDSNVTRGQMAAFLVRALGYTDDGGGDLFTDDDGLVFEADIDKLGTAGVTRGCNPPDNDRFCPDSFVTRGQMAAFLRRALD